jgi:hypothetical protein
MGRAPITGGRLGYLSPNTRALAFVLMRQDLPARDAQGRFAEK